MIRASHSNPQLNPQLVNRCLHPAAKRNSPRAARVSYVKDGFTRINLEREKERKQRQAVYTASIEAKQKEAEQRPGLFATLYRLFGETDPDKRGKQFKGAL